MTEFNLAADRVFRAQKIADMNFSLRSISSIRVEPRDAGGVWIVATQGQIMLIQRDLHGCAPRPLAATFRPQQAPIDPELGEEGYHWHGARLAFDDPGEDASLAGIAWYGSANIGAWAVVEPLPADTKWPDWRRTVAFVQGNDSRDKPAPEGYTTSLLSALADGWDGFRFHEFGARHQSRLVLSDSDRDAIGVIMPRVCPQTDDRAVGEWLRDIGRGDLAGGAVMENHE